MESAKYGNEYNLMVEYDFNKPIDAAIIFDSDEDESNNEINTPLFEKHDNEHQKVTKNLDMPSLEGYNSTTKIKLDDVVTGCIKKYIRETKKKHCKEPPKRKSSTTSNNSTFKKKSKIEEEKRKAHNMKEIQRQHNKHSFNSQNNNKNCQLTYSSIEPNESEINVGNDVRSQNNASLNIANSNGSSSDSIKSKAEPIEDLNSLGDRSEGMGKVRNTSTSSLPAKTNNNQPITIYIDPDIKLLRNAGTSLNNASEGIGNRLDTSTSSSPTYYRQYNEQIKPACIEQSVESVKHSQHTPKKLFEGINNVINKVDNQWNITISSLLPNTDSSCTVTNVSKEIINQLNTSSFSSPTNTNITPVSINITPKIQTQENNVDSVTYDHLKPLLNTVSEHLVLIWNRLYACNSSFNYGGQNLEHKEQLKNTYYNYKMRLFDLSYSTVVNIILPRIYDKTFVKNFIDNTVVLSKSVDRQTTKEISFLYLEMISWAQKMKKQISSESADNKMLRQALAPTATNTNCLPEIAKELHSTNNHTCSIRPPEKQRLPPWGTKSGPPPSYANKTPPPPLYNNNLPPYNNNFITSEQTKIINSTYSEHQQLSTRTVQKKKGVNQRQQVTQVNSSDGLRQDFYSTNITQVKNSNNNPVNVSSNHLGYTHQDYVSPYFKTVKLNSNCGQSTYCNNNPVNNSPYPRGTAESDCQRFLSSFRSQNTSNNGTSSQYQNHCYRANDASSQGCNNYANNAYQNQVNNSPQEYDRSSISRDSGFYSPRHCEQEQSTSPLITHVTSLHPDAVNITKGSCFVCGKNTNQKCIGCYAIYYCSYGCQSFDWRNHIAYCTNTTHALRK